ncbi:MAG: histidine phosphatase family protein [Coprococcus sp.]|nr:histidine phosphatase family protein [Coprococcus sp.]
MELIWIRHFATKGNRERRYIGATDEPLDRAALPEKLRVYPKAEQVVISPMQRCRETAQIIYPGVPVHVCGAFRECDFGDFEGKNYEELKDDIRYQRWLDSKGTLPFPGGEGHEDFIRRCVLGMEEIMRRLLTEKCVRAAFVVHGGTIMAVCAAFAGKTFYDWQVENGGGFGVSIDEIAWEQGNKYFREIERL